MAGPQPVSPAEIPLRQVQAVGPAGRGQSLVGPDQEDQAAAMGQGAQGPGGVDGVNMPEGPVDHARAPREAGQDRRRVRGPGRIGEEQQGRQPLPSPAAPT